MTQKEKELLLKDLCMRLPYGVKLQKLANADSDVEPVKLYSINVEGCCPIRFYTYEGKALTVCEESRLFRPGNFLRYKPYLFPLSSMTEEQKRECFKEVDIELDENDEIWSIIYDSEVTTATNLYEWLYVLDFLNKNHFDYRGLIEKGLAIDATNLNIY